jgi:hypothetical protein
MIGVAVARRGLDDLPPCFHGRRRGASPPARGRPSERQRDRDLGVKVGGRQTTTASMPGTVARSRGSWTNAIPLARAKKRSLLRVGP